MGRDDGVSPATAAAGSRQAHDGLRQPAGSQQTPQCRRVCAAHSWRAGGGGLCSTQGGRWGVGLCSVKGGGGRGAGCH